MQHQDLVSVCAVPSEAQAQHHVKELLHVAGSTGGCIEGIKQRAEDQ